jgi:hypothetical protein
MTSQSTMTIPPTKPSKPYSEVRSQLGTGDILFLHGTSPAGLMIERLEEEFHWPPFSHVGMVINDSGKLYLWDAPGGGDCFPDPYADDQDNRIYRNEVHTGCRVSVLDDVLAYYATRVDVGGFWIRQLTSGVSADQFTALRKFINRVDGLSFPKGIGGKDPATSGLGENFAAGQVHATLFYGTYFCSQLLADTYMHMGLLEMNSLPPNGYSPAAFGVRDPAQLGLKLVPPAALGPVFFVDWDRPKVDHGIPCNQ